MSTTATSSCSATAPTDSISGRARGARLGQVRWTVGVAGSGLLAARVVLQLRRFTAQQLERPYRRQREPGGADGRGFSLVGALGLGPRLLPALPQQRSLLVRGHRPVAAEGR